jgi:hypothetical protein
LLWAVLVKKEVRNDADCQEILYTYIEIVTEVRKQSRENAIELNAEKVIQTIPCVAAAAAAAAAAVVADDNKI